MYNRLFSHENKWNLATYDNMNGVWKHFAKWVKSDRERKTQYDLLICEI